MSQSKILVKLTFFKESGKYYSSGEYESEKQHMFEIFSEVKEMRRTKVTGLIGGWNGPVLVEAPKFNQGYPGLILGLSAVDLVTEAAKILISFGQPLEGSKAYHEAWSKLKESLEL